MGTPSLLNNLLVLFAVCFGRRKDWKKAYVTLAEGSTIEMMSGE